MAIIPLLLTLDLSTTLPSNDDRDQAIVIDSLPYFANQNNDQATVEPNEFSQCGNLYASIWYQYTPTQHETVNFSTWGSDYDTLLSLWHATPPTEIACNDNALTDQEYNQTAQLSWPLKAKETYLINIASATPTTGNLIFRVRPAVSDLQILQSPPSQELDICTSVTLTVEARGSEPLYYQWYQGKLGDLSQPLVNLKTFTTPPLNHSISYWMRVTNATGYLDSPLINLKVPAKFNSLGVDAVGKEICTKANFQGKITTLRGLSGNHPDLVKEDTATVTMQLEPASTHLGELAELVMFAYYQPHLYAEKLTFMRTEERWIAWEGSFPTLTVAEPEVLLQKRQAITIFQGPLNSLFSGITTVYLGYRLANGDLVYSGEPISFTLAD